MSLAGWSLAQMATLLAIGGTAITGLYLLRMRRRQVVVPFARLWEHVTRESESRRLWRKLRRVASWLVQMILLALLVLALGDPRPEIWLRDPRTIAVVIDGSASMSGRSDTEDGTRLDAALTRTRAELRTLGPADRAVVVLAGSEVTVPSPLGSDVGRLSAGLEGLTPRPGEADMTSAIALAHSAISEHPGPEVLIVTDGALDRAALESVHRCVTAPTPCRVARVTGPTSNVAITAFAARRYPDDREHVEVLAEVRNLGDEAASVVLAVEADGVSIGQRELLLAAGQRAREVLPGLDAARARLVARLRPVDAATATALGPAHDDVAHAVVPPLRPIEVALVTDGTNLFLEAALLTLDDHIRLTGLSPEQAREETATLEESDVVFFDVADAPLPDPLPQTDLVIFDPWRREQSPVPIGLAKRVKRPFLTEASRNHALLEHVVLKDVNLARGTVFATDPGDLVLVSTLGEPIVVLREGQRSLLVFGFDARQSDFPMRVAFPLMVQNAIRQFETRHAGFVASLQVGKSRELSLSEIGLVAEGVTRVAAIGPVLGAPAVEAAVQDGRFRLRAIEPGIHRIRAIDGEAAGAEVEIAVNQGSADASSLRDRLADVVPDEAAASTAPPPAPLGDGPLWTLILVLVAAAIAVEWATYHRRITV